MHFRERCELTLSYSTDFYEAEINGLNEQNDLLSHRLENALQPPPWYETNEFWFTLGAVAGAVATVGIVWVITE